MTPIGKNLDPAAAPHPKANYRIRVLAYFWSLLVAVCWFALSWESIGGGSGFTGVVFIMLSLLIATPLGLASITFFANKTRPKLVRAFGPMSIGIFLGLGSFILISPRQEKWNNGIAMERGDRLIQALDEFESDHGSFPKQLPELVPKYIDSIPLPYPGLFPSAEFTYMDNGDGFEITFPTGLFDYYSWNRVDSWYIVHF